VVKEKNIVKPIVEYLNSLPNCKAIKLHGSVYTIRGTPDVICCYRGHTILIEAKTPDGSRSESQKYQMELWQEADATVAVCRSVKEVKSLIKCCDLAFS